MELTRIVTRPDFDGLVCAVLLRTAIDNDMPIQWVEPGEIQRGKLDILPGDIIANLPYHENCSLWFDHHCSNKIDTPFEGDFRITPSAARIIYDYYRDRYSDQYEELIRETDRIDSADLTMDEVRYPGQFPYVLLSMTIKNRDGEDEAYWNHVVQLLTTQNIKSVIADPQVAAACSQVEVQNSNFEKQLLAHTTLEGCVTVTDFRPLGKAPIGNRFLVYSLFPQAIASIKIRYDDNDSEKIIVGVGHSIFNRQCQVNVGFLLSRFGGGGHRGAAACSFHAKRAGEYIPLIIEAMKANQPNESTS